ncbi:hypothetical protein NMG60_11029555 [Bertholletia excelsa]
MASAAHKVLVSIVNGMEPMESVPLHAGVGVMVVSVKKQLQLHVCPGMKILPNP